VVLLLFAVFGLLLAASTPALGLSLLNVAPVLVAALWFGRYAGAGAGLAATGLFALAAIVDHQSNVFTSSMLRAAIFCTAGYGLGVLFEQRQELRTGMAAQERELAELRSLQEALAPREPHPRPALNLAATYVPAQQGVSGDFYLIAPGPRESTVVVIGDVLGKGLEAARRAAFVRAALASFAPFSDDPANLLEMANQSLVERAGTSQMFVTAACVVVRPENGTISCALAGHPPPLRLDEPDELGCGRPGVPLGLADRVGCATSSSKLATGAGVLLYTDGLVEARALGDDRPTSEQLGWERVRELIRGLRGEPPRTVVDRVREAAERFAGGSLPDDLCLVALRATS